MRLRSEREISDIQRGERRTKGGGRCRGKSSCFSAAPPSTHNTQRKNKPRSRAAVGAASSAVTALAESASAASHSLGSLWKDQELMLPVMG